MASLNDMDLRHLVGTRVGSSTLLKEIARGSMGTVFVAYQRSLKRQIAVKVLPKSILTSQTAQLFQQEAELAAVLSHPNIIPIYEVGDMKDFLFLAMQLVDGKPLSYYIERAQKNVLPSKRTLPVKATIKIIISVLDALDYAHSQNIIHRDIKPGNILIERQLRRPLIVDFGVAQLTNHTTEISNIIAGTPTHMAPEQLLNPKVDGRADIYSVGIMMYEMLTPEPLFSEFASVTDFLKMKVKRKDGLFTKKPSEVNPKLNEEMDQIFSAAVAYAPENRYATCYEFREHLERYVGRYLTN